MTRSGRVAQMPMRDGVSASVVAVPAGHWPHLLDFLAQRMPGISRSEWARRLDQGLVLQESGQSAQAHQPCLAGQRYFYYRHVADEPPLPGQAAVVFEDDHLLVADKPHFMPVTPSGPYVQQCLLVQLKRLTGQADLVPLHRIDRETAGLVLFGKAMALRRLFPALRVDYVRVVGTQWVDDPEARFQSVDIRQPLMLALPKAEAAIVDDLPKGFRLPEGELQSQQAPLLPQVQCLAPRQSRLPAFRPA